MKKNNLSKVGDNKKLPDIINNPPENLQINLDAEKENEVKETLRAFHEYCEILNLSMQQEQEEQGIIEVSEKKVDAKEFESKNFNILYEEWEIIKEKCRIVNALYQQMWEEEALIESKKKKIDVKEVEDKNFNIPEDEPG